MTPCSDHHWGQTLNTHCFQCHSKQTNELRCAAVRPVVLHLVTPIEGKDCGFEPPSA